MSKFLSKFHPTIRKCGENLVYSYYSILIAFSMLYQGTSGEVKKELGKYFSIEPEKLKSLIEAADALKVANAIYVNKSRKDVELRDDYIKLLEKYYDSIIKVILFNNDELKLINDWIEEKTEGNIVDFLDRFDKDDFLFIVNCIYFKESWKVKFDKKNTSEELFNGKYKVQMMKKVNTKELYGEHDWNGLIFKSCTLPYENEKFKMIFIKPDKSSKLERELFKYDFVKKITSEQKEEELGRLFIPRFKIRTKEELVDKFKIMGFKAIFESRLDYTLMFKNNISAFVGRIIHESFIKVDEEGTEAAAVTGIMLKKGLKSSFVLNSTFIAILCFEDFPIFIVKYVKPPDQLENLITDAKQYLGAENYINILTKTKEIRDEICKLPPTSQNYCRYVVQNNL
jgi:serpin B